MFLILTIFLISLTAISCDYQSWYDSDAPKPPYKVGILYNKGLRLIMRDVKVPGVDCPKYKPFYEGSPLREGFKDNPLLNYLLKDDVAAENKRNERNEYVERVRQVGFIFRDPDIEITRIEVDRPWAVDTKMRHLQPNSCAEKLGGGIGHDNIVLWIWSYDYDYDWNTGIRVYGVPKNQLIWYAIDWFTDSAIANKESATCAYKSKPILKGDNQYKLLENMKVHIITDEKPKEQFEDFKEGTRWAYMYDFYNADVEITNIEVSNEDENNFECAVIRQGGVGQNYVRIFIWKDGVTGKEKPKFSSIVQIFGKAK